MDKHITIDLLMAHRLIRSAFMEGLNINNPGDYNSRRRLWRRSHSRIIIKQFREECEGT